MAFADHWSGLQDLDVRDVDTANPPAVRDLTRVRCVAVTRPAAAPKEEPPGRSRRPGLSPRSVAGSAGHSGRPEGRSPLGDLSSL